MPHLHVYAFIHRTCHSSSIILPLVVDARAVLLSSGLGLDALARIWDVAEVDRDGRLNSDEFCIACHLCRLSKKGNGVEAVKAKATTNSTLLSHYYVVGYYDVSAYSMSGKYPSLRALLWRLLRESGYIDVF
jgi:hypothetical protein